MLALQSGVGIYSVAMIVAAFMAGLGLGSRLGGSLSARVSPRQALHRFAALELSIAVFGALSPTLYYDVLYARLPGLYATLPRAALAHFAGLLLPTALMGMSLPFLVRARVADPESAARTVALLYGLNTLGAAAGALVTPWLLMRYLGIRGAVLVAALGNLLAGGSALFLARGTPEAETPAPGPGPAEPAPRLAEPFSLWLSLYALSGFCALALEIVWFRIMDVSVRSTAFSFGSMLAVYLAGSGLGSLAGGRGVGRLREPLKAFLLCQCALLAYAAAAVTALATLPAATPVYSWFHAYWAQRGGFVLGETSDPGAFVRLYVLFPLLLYGPPTLLMGLSFPVLQRAVHDDPRTSGRKVGYLQAANILGCVAGSLLVGLVTLDRLGCPGTLRLLMAAGLLFAALGWHRHGPRWFLPATAALLVGLFALPGSRPLWQRLHGAGDPGDLVAEDATGVGAIFPDGKGRFRVFVDGKSHSWLPFGGIHTSLGAFPAVIHPAPASVATVGLGSGNTAWAAACREETRTVTVFELSRAQPRLLRSIAAREDIPGLSRFLADPRVALHIDDGRRALRQGSTRYDVIQADALWPQLAGSGNLYSQEFFRLCASRLAPGGVMCTWAPSRRVAAAFHAAFPEVLSLRDGEVLLGSAHRIPYDVPAWRARLESPRLQGYLGESTARQILRELRASRRSERPPRRFPPNRDLFPRDEFSSPGS